MGSGTTGRAALMLGYRYLGFELDAATCEMAMAYIEDGLQVRLPI